VLADALYGESEPFIQTLEELGLTYVVAIRENHAVWLPTGARVRHTRWRTFQRDFSDGTRETRYIREIVFGKRGRVRYFELTSDPKKVPAATTRLVMTNLPGDVRQRVGNDYGMRTWIEYGLNHSKHEFGWADYRLTRYPDIERWWELVSSAYLLVRLQTAVFASRPATSEPAGATIPSATTHAAPVTAHPGWDAASGWKATLNNLRLLIRPFCACSLLLPWMRVFPVPGLIEKLQYLITCINGAT
jgi:hypothetical protein